MKFLVQFNVLGHIFGIFDGHIFFKTVDTVGDSVAKMKDSIHPWKLIAAELHIWKEAWRAQPANTLRL